MPELSADLGPPVEVARDTIRAALLLDDARDLRRRRVARDLLLKKLIPAQALELGHPYSLVRMVDRSVMLDNTTQPFPCFIVENAMTQSIPQKMICVAAHRPLRRLFFEWIRDLQSTDPLARVQILADKPVGVGLERGHENQCIPERNAKTLFIVGRSEHVGGLHADHPPGRVSLNQIARILTRDRFRNLACHGDVKLLEHLRAQHAVASVPQLPDERRRDIVPSARVGIMRVDEDVRVNERAHRSCKPSRGTALPPR